EPPYYGGNACAEEQDFEPHGPIWDTISADARSLVTSLTKWEPSHRPSAEEVLGHPWLRKFDEQPSIMSSKTQVLKNLRRFSNTSTFLSLCAASVAQQLSRRGLKELEQVFKELDANGDGILELDEVRAGFQKILGRGSATLEEIEEMFSRLDIDGSGAIDYTEFLAAGLGNRVNSEVEALWAAFKAFDVHESDGNITEAEIAHVLYEAGAGRVWSADKCQELAREVVQQFDRDGNGSLDFDEWLEMMKRCSGDESPDASRLSADGSERCVSL
ncbi:CPK3, partial [Symbiodinium pilosum]